MKKYFNVRAIIIFNIWLTIHHVSCEKAGQPHRVSDKTFVQIYCDVVTQADFVDVKLRNAFIDSVINSYHVTYEDYIYTKNSFTDDPEKWKKIFEEIVKELEKRKSEFDSNQGSKRSDKDINQTADQP